MDAPRLSARDEEIVAAIERDREATALRSYIDTELAFPEAHLQEVLRFWRSQDPPMSFDEWFAPYFYKHSSPAPSAYCTRLNHSRGAGCEKQRISLCTYDHSCMLCEKPGHGAFQKRGATNDFLCKWLNRFYAELFDLLPEHWRAEPRDIDSLIRLIRENRTLEAPLRARLGLPGSRVIGLSAAAPTAVPTAAAGSRSITSVPAKSSPPPTDRDRHFPPLSKPAWGGSGASNRPSTSSVPTTPGPGYVSTHSQSPSPSRPSTPLSPAVGKGASSSTGVSPSSSTSSVRVCDEDSAAEGSDDDDDDEQFRIPVVERVVDSLPSEASTDANVVAQRVVIRYKSQEDRLGDRRSTNVEVYKATYHFAGTSTLVAVKMWRLSDVAAKKKSRKEFEQEMTTLRELGALGVVPMLYPLSTPVHRFTDDPHAFYSVLVMEYCPRTLRELVEQLDQAGQPLQEHFFISIVMQLLRAYELCHSHKLTHRDVKPDNVLVAQQSFADGAPRIKLCDFALGKRVKTQSEAMYTRINPANPAEKAEEWMPPDMCKDPRGYTMRTDIWGLGCLIYFVATGGKALFHSAADREGSVSAERHCQLLRRHDLHIRRPLMCDLIEQLTLYDSTKRISISDARSHPALWDGEYICHFLSELHNDRDRKSDFSASLSANIEADSARILYCPDVAPGKPLDWFSRLPGAMQQELLEQARKHNFADGYFNAQRRASALEFLRWVRHFLTHSPLAPRSLQHAWAAAICNSFPRLLLELWRICRGLSPFEVVREYKSEIKWPSTCR